MCSAVTPGAQALEIAQTMQELDVFKKPVGFAKKSKAKILDEQSYVKKMSQIIERDYFPDLEKLRAQIDYMDALKQNDIKRMRELYAKYSSGQTIQERVASPATFETPLHNSALSKDEIEIDDPSPSSERSTKSTCSEEKKISLDEFLQNNTSEDNASFEDMIVQEQQHHRLKYAWLYESEEKLKAIANSDKQQLAIEDGMSKKIYTWDYKSMNYIMYIPDGVELTKEEKIELAKKKQIVNHNNTRFKENPFNEQQNQETINELAKTKSRFQDGKIGVDGKTEVNDLNPLINGFSFVATPSPVPGECESPLMTWGQIEGTPFRLDGGDTPLHKTSQRSFKMSEPSKREQILMKLTEKAGEKNRDRKNKALETARRSLASPSPRSNIDRFNTMSPAARKLATQKLRISITPSPRRLSSTKSPLMGVKTPNTPRQVTPRSKISAQSIPSTSKGTSEGPVLTDNLLNLPRKRQRASDFF